MRGRLAVRWEQFSLSYAKWDIPADILAGVVLAKPPALVSGRHVLARTLTNGVWAKPEAGRSVAGRRPGAAALWGLWGLWGLALSGRSGSARGSLLAAPASGGPGPQQPQERQVLLRGRAASGRAGDGRNPLHPESHGGSGSRGPASGKQASQLSRACRYLLAATPTLGGWGRVRPEASPALPRELPPWPAGPAHSPPSPTAIAASLLLDLLTSLPSHSLMPALPLTAGAGKGLSLVIDPRSRPSQRPRVPKEGPGRAERDHLPGGLQVKRVRLLHHMLRPRPAPNPRLQPPPPGAIKPSCVPRAHSVLTNRGRDKAARQPSREALPTRPGEGSTQASGLQVQTPCPVPWPSAVLDSGIRGAWWLRPGCS